MRAALPGKPLFDLIEVVERMVKDAAYDFVRRIGVAVTPRNSV
jgi:hypothetical protein